VTNVQTSKFIKRIGIPAPKRKSSPLLAHSSSPSSTRELRSAGSTCSSRKVEADHSVLEHHVQVFPVQWNQPPLSAQAVFNDIVRKILKIKEFTELA
jgi:hypothetical protein